MFYPRGKKVIVSILMVLTLLSMVTTVMASEPLTAAERLEKSKEIGSQIGSKFSNPVNNPGIGSKVSAKQYIYRIGKNPSSQSIATSESASPSQSIATSESGEYKKSKSGSHSRDIATSEIVTSNEIGTSHRYEETVSNTAEREDKINDEIENERFDESKIEFNGEEMRYNNMSREVEDESLGQNPPIWDALWMPLSTIAIAFSDL